ncbi:MAG: hypothetical protein ACRD2L_11865, partial [Terriglobia bacterium]
VYNRLPYGSEYRLLPMLYGQHPVDPTGLWYVDESEFKTPALKGVLACHLSCTLIHRSVLEFCEFRYMGSAFDDMAFSKDAIDHGFLILVDTSIKPRHLHSEREQSDWTGMQK